MNILKKKNGVNEANTILSKNCCEYYNGTEQDNVNTCN